MSLCEPLASFTASQSADVVLNAPALNRRAIRQVLNRALGAPAELDAFLIDYFPDIYRLTSDGMNRDVKLNLLLWNTEEDLLRTQVEQSFPQQVTEVRALLGERAYSLELPNDEPRKRFVVILSATIEETDRHKITALLGHLRLHTSDAELTIEAVESGSVILICTATDEAFHLLFEEFVVGKLPRLLDFPVLDLYPAHLPPRRTRQPAPDPADRRAEEWKAASRSRPTEFDPERNAQTLRIRRKSPLHLYAALSFSLTVGLGLLVLGLAGPHPFGRRSDWTAQSQKATRKGGQPEQKLPPMVMRDAPVAVAALNVAPSAKAAQADDDDETVHPTEPSVLAQAPPDAASVSAEEEEPAPSVVPAPEPRREPAASIDSASDVEPAPARKPTKRHHTPSPVSHGAHAAKEEFQISSFCNGQVPCLTEQVTVLMKVCLKNVKQADIDARLESAIVLKKIGVRYFPYNHYQNEQVRNRITQICTCVQEELADKQPDLSRWPVHIWILPGS
jgi:hypothetical protein